ncbi:sensor histidine kinase [Shewanella maritima]|uniref:sensor histidine kinase n=1 Tax=Shewanella maritima TaxID=2520507 RepID=UPI0037358315
MSTFLIFNIYLFYGLVFFAIGCVVVFRNFKYSQLAISPTLWALALFGFSHAFHEWSELYVILFNHELNRLSQQVVQWLILLKLSLSFAGLMIFAWLLFHIDHSRFSKLGRVLAIIVIVVYSLLMLNYYFDGYWFAETYSDATTYTRFLMGFGSATLAGVGLIKYGYDLGQDDHQYGGYFMATGASLCLYGVLAGLVPTDAHFSVPVYRTIAAACVLVSLYKALKIFDIEKENATEAKLTRAIEADKYKAIGHLAMGVAHEINNPLASSNLALDLIERKLPDNSQAITPYIERARLGISRASSISKELLTYARPDSAPESNVQLLEVIEGVTHLLSHKFNDYDIEFHCPVSARICGRKVKLEELLINLINNAMDASQRGQRIRVNVTDTDNAITVTVKDEGEGMALSELKRATELFYTTKPIGEGTGLGLAICEQIVSAHGGTMELHSEVKSGTEVLLTFPKQGFIND